MTKIDDNKRIESESKAEEYLMKATELLYVRVPRQEFLISVLKNKDLDDIKKFIETGDVNIFSREYLDTLAKKIIKEETYRTSTISFATGMPGGYAATATIPTDILQNLAHSLRLVQKLLYIYGVGDLYDKNGKLQEKGKNILIAYFGVMLGVNSATTTVGLFSKNAPNEIAKKIKYLKVNETVWYPIIKSVLKYFGFKVTKKGMTEFVKKAVPIVGGFVSGGITYVGMNKSGERLRHRLSEISFDYTEEKAKSDFEEYEKIVKEYREEEL